jgi:pimeloyl-ACP methyl ester carboxylesterase
MVDIGGYQLHIHCMGEGSPTVILETLSGGMSPYWAWVQPAVAAHTRVCAYDRAGRAWSQPRPHAAEDPAQQTALELHTLLEKAGIPGPYILVGHSIGGVYIRRYTGLFPEEVSGVVLVDAAHPEQLARYPELLKEAEAYGRLSSVFPFLARIGLFRLYFATGGEIDFQDLPPRQHDETAAFWSSPEYFTSQRSELDDALKIYASEQDMGNLGSLPLFVITASETGPYPAWPALQDDLAGLSTDSIHQIIEGATHSSLVFNPAYARQVSAAIIQVVEAIRDGKRLAE